MKLIHIAITMILIALLAASVAAFSMPSLLGRPIVPGIKQQSMLELPSQAITPEDVKAQTAGETFTLTVSGNVYVDKIPVKGAVVSVYLNGRYMGKATSSDLYQFSVPGARTGDKIRVDATYDGHTGSASEVVKFKSVYLDVNVDSGKSFIRNALEMMTTGDDTGSQPQQTAATSTPQPTSTASGSSPTTSSTDTNALISQVNGDTSKSLLNTFGRNNAMLTRPVTTNTADAGNNMQITSLDDAMKIAGVEVPDIS